MIIISKGLILMKTIRFRRKREGKTNYKKRLALLKSGKPRLVIRRSNKHITLQVVNYDPDGDKVLVTVNSKVLAKKGWKYSTKSLPAAYLAGVLLGKSALEKGVEEAIVDIGMFHHINGSRLTAAIKGAVDAGLKVPVGDNIFPSDDRLSGAHISDEVVKSFEKLKKELL